MQAFAARDKRTNGPKRSSRRELSPFWAFLDVLTLASAIVTVVVVSCAMARMGRTLEMSLEYNARTEVYNRYQ